MNTLRCVVVDDEPLASALIASYVRRTPFLELVAECNNAEEALDIIGHGGTDLLFLDIHMPHVNGLQLAERIPPHVRVIFTTAYADHAVEGFRLNAVHYLLKPISYEEFLGAATRALPASGQGENTVGEEPAYLTVKSEYRLVRIPLADIDYVEGLKDYVKIYSGGSQLPVLTLMSMKSLEEMLPSRIFMRVHRSFIVNLEKVRIIERNCINMNGTLIPVSESYRKRFASAIGMPQE